MAGFQVAGDLFQKAGQSINTGLDTFNTILQDRQKLDEANRLNAQNNVVADFRNYMSNLRNEGVDALQAADHQAALQEIMARRGVTVAPRELDIAAEARAALTGAQSDAITNREFAQGEALAAANPVLQDYRARLFRDPNATLSEEETNILRRASLLDDAMEHRDNREQTLSERSWTNEKRDQTRYGWNRTKLADEKADAADEAFGNINWDQDYYSALQEHLASIRALPASQQMDAVAGFQSMYAARNQLSPEDVERMNLDDQRLVAANTAEIEKAQAQIEAATQRRDRLPIAQILSKPIQHRGEFTERLANAFNIDRDYLKRNDVVNGIDNLLEEAQKEFDKNPEYKELGYDVYSLAWAAAQSSISAQGDEGKRPTIDLWKWSKQDAADFITSIGRELLDADYVAQYLKANDDIKTATEYARHLPERLIQDRQALRQQYRERRANVDSLLKALREPDR